MYLHIGNNNIVDEKELIAIYNIETIKETDEYKKIIKDLEKKHLLIRGEDVEEKSLIIVNKDENIVGYISNISSTTIAKRTETNINQN